MHKQSGLSSLLAAAASLLVVGIIATATPALAQSEEGLAAPQGSFVSTIAAPPAVRVRAIAVPAVFYGASEEDAAVPQGSFTSAMAEPEIEGAPVKRARKVAAEPGSLAAVNLPEIVAAGLE